MLSVRAIRDPETWNRLVSGFPITSALQSWGWGEVKRLSGWEPFRLAILDGEVPVAAAQVLRRRFAGPFVMLYAPRGPALRAIEDLPRVAEALAQWAGRGVYLKLEPEVGQPAEAPPPRFAPLVLEETIQPEYSLWVDLAPDPDAVLARMKPKTRYNIRLSARKGVVAAVEEDFEAFWALFTETNRRAKLLQHDRSYYEAVLREMNQPHGAAFLSIARLEGKPLSAGLFVAFAGKVDYLYGGSSRAHKNVMAPYAMHWNAMRWGMERGYRIYDLWGVPRVLSPESHAYGIYRFKEGFGGQRVRFPAYDYPLSSLYTPLKRALRLRKDFVNWRMRGTRRDVL